MVYKSRLSQAQRGDYVFIVDAAYGPGKDSRPVCSICWSLLDYEWGRGYGAGFEHPDITSESDSEEYVDKQGESWLSWVDTRRCCNPECDGAVRYRTLPELLSFSNPFHPEDMKQFKIKSVKYKRGKHGDDGVFRLENKKGEWKPIRLELGTRGVTLEHDGPWAYIDPGEFKDEIPDAWTVRDGKIKVNAKSKRFDQISKWFEARRLRLSDL